VSWKGDLANWSGPSFLRPARSGRGWPSRDRRQSRCGRNRRSPPLWRGLPGARSPGWRWSWERGTKRSPGARRPCRRLPRPRLRARRDTWDRPPAHEPIPTSRCGSPCGRTRTPSRECRARPCFRRATRSRALQGRARAGVRTGRHDGVAWVLHEGESTNADTEIGRPGSARARRSTRTVLSGQETRNRRSRQ
jgi:hypothetical protein